MSSYKRLHLAWLSLSISVHIHAQDVTIFPRVTPPKEIRASEILDNLRIDGRLDEADWQTDRPGSGFFQTQPEQGKPLTFDTKEGGYIFLRTHNGQTDTNLDTPTVAVAFFGLIPAR